MIAVVGRTAEDIYRMIITNASRDELIALAKKLLSAGEEDDSDSLYEEFSSHFSHPDLANLFYWPEKHDARADNPALSCYNPTPEEIVDIGINHKPITLALKGE